MQPTIKFKRTHLILCFLLFGIIQISQAQSTTLPFDALGFSQACARIDFNDFTVTFNINNADAFSNTNTFTIQLSDENGDFSNAINVEVSEPGEFTASSATMTFPFPEDTAGENYRIRIRSSSPVTFSNLSTSFAAYYKPHDTNFSINGFTEDAAFCSGSSYILSIDDEELNPNSPLVYPSLIYYWYRETNSGQVLVAMGTEDSIEISTPGTYFVETFYGSCTPSSMSNSNRVNISEATDGQISSSIVSSLGNPFCPDNGPTSLSSISGNDYQWFKDGNLIDGANNQSFETDESGEYSVRIDLGDCIATGSFTLVSQLFESSINVNEINLIDEGETLTAIVTDNANAPTYEWFFNNIPIQNQTTNTLEVSDFGLYRVEITETQGCEITVEYMFRVEEDIEQFPDVAEIPNLISPNGDGINDTWMIPTDFVSGTETSIRIFSSKGELVFETNDYQNNWPIENIELTPINKVYYYIISPQSGSEKKGSITVIK